MINEAQRDLFRILRESQNRYTYFLLAAAGAAIGFSLSQTHGSALDWHHISLAAAVALWAGSFFSGCRYLAYVNSTLYSNGELLRIQSGQHPEVGTHPAYVAAASEGLRKALESNSEAANWWGHWQFRLLAAGAGCYVAWHVWSMYLARMAPLT